MKSLCSSKLFITCVILYCYSYTAMADHEISYRNSYLGARIGYSYNENSCMNTKIECDRDEAGYGLFAGYNLNPRTALELSFNDIGDSVAKYPDVNLVGELREIDLAVKLSYPLYNQAHIYGKLGAAYWTGKVSGGNDELDDSGVSPLLGGGIEFPLNINWTTRLEYQYIHQVGNDEMGEANPHFLGISFVWNFSDSHKTSANTAITAPVTATPEPAVQTTTQPAIQPSAKTPEPTVTEQRITIDEKLGGSLFDVNKTEISNTAAIDAVVNLLTQTPSLDVSIIGHTDARGDAKYNQRLSETRANSVAKYLQSKGVASNRIKASGMGEEQPVADNQTDEGRAKNRRVEFVIHDRKNP